MAGLYPCDLERTMPHPEARIQATRQPNAQGPVEDVAHANVESDFALRVDQAFSDPAFAVVSLDGLGQQAYEITRGGVLLYVYAIVEGYELIVENLLDPPADRAGVLAVASAVATKLR
jgi:hypothetical protein